MLEVLRDHYKINSKQMFHLIQGMRRQVEILLDEKDLKYDKLRPVLVPSKKRREIALIFDTEVIESNWYGFEVMKRVIPLFNKSSNHSVLLGDYLGEAKVFEQRFEAFREAVQLRRNVTFLCPNQFFIVYLNNLTNCMIDRFDTNLSKFQGYVGYADMTYSSKFKMYLSTMLVNSLIKFGKIILQGHEPDRDKTENVNMSGYPFEENGYVCRSICDDLMGVFLSYKIERPVFPGFEVDTEFALNAIVDTPVNIRDCEVAIDKEKLQYIVEQKGRSVSPAGLKDFTIDKLSETIKEKMQENYIYNLVYLDEFDVAKFNLILEFPKSNGHSTTRLLAALEYKYWEKKLRLITLY